MCRVWLTMNIMRCVPLHQPHTWVRVWSSHALQRTGTSDGRHKMGPLPAAGKPLRPVGCFKMKCEMCCENHMASDLVYELTCWRCSTKKVHLLDVTVHLLCRCELHYAKSVQKFWCNSLISHKGGKPNFLSHTITSVAELQCRNVSYITLGGTWQNCAKTQ